MSESICPSDGVETLPVEALATADTSLAPTTVVGARYRIEGQLGQGAMGAVYEATQLSMQRTVALKVLLGDGIRDPQELRRFYREAQAASRLEHPHVVQIYDFGFDEDTRRPFIAMELIRGESLRTLIEREAPLPVARTARLIGQVGRALVAAHAKGVVHRDLKPDNVMVRRLADGDEHATVLDFGIAKSIEGPRTGSTSTGQVIGTPRYMSPEQVRSESVGPAADLYALGGMLHELLTRAPPFPTQDAVELMIAHLNQAPPRLDPTRFGADLCALQAGLLDKLPAGRPRDAGEVVRVLRAIEQGRAVGHIELGGEASSSDLDPGDATVRPKTSKRPVRPADSDPDLPFATTAARGRSSDAAAQAVAASSGASGPADPARESAAVRTAADDLAPIMPDTAGRKPWLALALLLLLGAAGGAIAWWPGEPPRGVTEGSPSANTATEAPPEATTAPETTAEAPSPARPEPVTPPTPPSEPASEVAETTKPAPELRRVWLRSRPAGAAVRSGRRYLGRTPLRVSVPPRGLKVRLTRDGHRPIDLTIRGDATSPVQAVLPEIPKLAPL